ncbi:MAG: hypothetical protein ACOYJ2_08150 [Rickettsiales bacterium]
MAVYKNKKAAAALAKVEITEAVDGRNVFFYVQDDAAREDMKRSLARSGLSFTIQAETKLGNHFVLVAQTPADEKSVATWLSKHDVTLSYKQKSVDPWVIRSILGFGGQTLQLASSFIRPNGRIDPTMFVFATANMAANVINLMYKSQDLDDPHQLKFLKERYNRTLSPHLSEGEMVLSTSEHRKDLRKTGDEKPQGFDDFMRRHSVSVGELGLRYLGAFGMAFPYEKYLGNNTYTNNWWGRIKDLKFPELNANKWRQFSGLSSIFGKTVALGSKVKDPYNPESHSWLDMVREKFTFLGGGIIEAGAFSALAYDCFINTAAQPADINKDRGIKWPSWAPKGLAGTRTRDWLGGIGASMFVTGYIVRSWASYGKRNVDMDELYAHVSDTLAKTTPEQLPQLIADTAADIKTHFSDNADLDYGTIYTALVNDLKRYHHIDLFESAAVLDVDSEQTKGNVSKEVPNVKVIGPVAKHMHEKASEIASLPLVVSR